jgi:hypothetical protein
VPPKVFDGEMNQLEVVEGGKSVGQQDDGLGGFQADEADGFNGMDHVLFPSEHGRVGQLQNLGRDRRVLRDELADFLQRASWRLHFLDDLGVGLERAGDLAHLGDKALHRFARQPGSWAKACSRTWSRVCALQGFKTW